MSLIISKHLFKTPWEPKWLAFIVVVLLSGLQHQAGAELLCVKSSIQARQKIALGRALVVAKGNTCPKGFKVLIDTGLLKGSSGSTGEVGPTGPAGAQGPAGPQGATGADGALRIYGDGSSGDFVADTSQDLRELLGQFRDFTIPARRVLTLPSGTIIRCTGVFTNQGTIRVLSESQGGVIEAFSATTLTAPSSAAPASGLVASVAASGEYGSNAVTLYGGQGGRAFSLPFLRGLLRLGIAGGGPGGAGRDTTGGLGGGTLTILAGGELVNSGVISANGANGAAGAGGGGGGAIILASKTSITQSGVVQVIGGAGGDSKINSAAGGGGGGGLVHLLAPNVSTTGGSILATGGNAGSTSVLVSASVRSAGGGGGAGIAAAGGLGCTLSSAAQGSVQTDCGNGAAPGAALPLITRADPSSFF